MFATFKNNNIYYKLLLLTAAIIWGSSFVVIKNTLYSLPPAFIMSIRFSIAFIVLFITFFKKLKLINKKIFLNGSIIGFFMALSYFYQNYGLIYTTPAKNAFLTTSYCVIVPFLFWILGKARPTINNILAAAFCVTGIGLISLNEHFAIQRGDYYTLLGGFFVAVQIVLFTIYSTKSDLMLISVVQFGTGAMFSLLLHFIYETPVNISAISSNSYLELLYLAFFCTLITMMFQNIGLEYIMPNQASLILSLESVFAIIFSILFFGEKPSLQMYIGFIAIFLSVLISETKLKFDFKSGRFIK